MKRSFVFVPAVLLSAFLLNSFVPREREGEKAIECEKPLNGAAVAKAEGTKAAPRNMAYKSVDGGQTWQHISEGLPEIEQKGESSVAELNGVLVATGPNGIKRSTDKGKHWEWVISEGGVGIAVERIEGGFAAISYSTETGSRRIRISMDSGKTWQVISDGLRPSSVITSIKQTGKYLICGHPDGIFRSADMGKTWNRVHKGIDDTDRFGFNFLTAWNSPERVPGSVFKVLVSGNVVYAVAVKAGC